jgi:hypothetical protein
VKKAFSYLGWILFGITLVGMVYFAFPKKDTCDYRGYVDNITLDTKNSCVWVTATSVFGDPPLKIKIDDNISIKDMYGNKIVADKIKIGNMIDLNFKEKANDSSKISEAKWVQVYLGESIKTKSNLSQLD